MTPEEDVVTKASDPATRQVKPAVKPARATARRRTAKPAPIAASAPVIAETPVAEQPEAVAAAETITVQEVPVTEVAAPAVAPAAPKENVMEATVKEAAAKGQAYFAEINDRAKAAFEKGQKAVEEMGEFSKGNVEAIVESGKIAAKGLETLGQGYAEYGRKTFEGATAALKNLATVKTPAEFLQMQTEFVRGQFDSLVAETSKNTEAFLKLAGDVAQPISNRVAVAAEKIKVAA